MTVKKDNTAAILKNPEIKNLNYQLNTEVYIFSYLLPNANGIQW